MKYIDRACVTFLLMFTAGCASVTNLHTARSVAEGHTEVTLAGTSLNMGVHHEIFPEGLHVPASVPSMEVTVRHGFSSRVDAGFKLYPVGLGIDVNVMLLEKGPVVVSLDPGVDGLYMGVRGNYASRVGVWLPLLIDISDGEIVTLTLGPKIGYMSASMGRPDQDLGGSGVFAGGSVGVRLQLTTRMALVPEFSAQRMVRGGGTMNFGWLYNGSLGVTF